MPAVIVMHKPHLQRLPARGHMALIVLEGRNLNECEGTVNRLIEERGSTLIHPYDNELVMTGQGTVGLEMLEDGLISISLWADWWRRADWWHNHKRP